VIGDDKLKELRKLPEAEFEVMQSIWNMSPPITTNMLMDTIGSEKGWKLQTLIVLLMRLVDRGFLRTEKVAKERTYYPEVEKEDYLRFETDNFVNRFHNHSIVNLINTLYDGDGIKNSELDELSNWLKERRGS
jgi:predicted transcriptional regulator